MSLSCAKGVADPAWLSFYLRVPFALGDLSAHAAIFVLVPTGVVGALDYRECQQELSALLKSTGQPLPSAE